MKTFSKKFLQTLAIMFVVVVFWAIVCITFSIGSVEYINIPVEVMGLVMTSGTLGYFIKSAVENKKKIEMNPEFLNNASEPEEASGIDEKE